MQVNENKDDLDVSLAKKDKRVLSLLYNRYTNNNKQQQNAMFSNNRYHIEGIKFAT